MGFLLSWHSFSGACPCNTCFCIYSPGFSHFNFCMLSFYNSSGTTWPPFQTTSLGCYWRGASSHLHTETPCLSLIKWLQGPKSNKTARIPTAFPFHYQALTDWKYSHLLPCFLSDKPENCRMSRTNLNSLRPNEIQTKHFLMWEWNSFGLGSIFIWMLTSKGI